LICRNSPKTGQNVTSVSTFPDLARWETGKPKTWSDKCGKTFRSSPSPAVPYDWNISSFLEPRWNIWNILALIWIEYSIAGESQTLVIESNANLSNSIILCNAWFDRGLSDVFADKYICRKLNHGSAVIAIRDCGLGHG